LLSRPSTSPALDHAHVGLHGFRVAAELFLAATEAVELDLDHVELLAVIELGHSDSGQRLVVRPALRSQVLLMLFGHEVQSSQVGIGFCSPFGEFRKVD
jgi:hypothetical protein